MNKYTRRLWSFLAVIVVGIRTHVGPRLSPFFKKMGLQKFVRNIRCWLERAPKEVDGFIMTGSLPVHNYYLDELRAGRMEPFTVALFKQAVKAGMTVLDVGGFLGYYALVAARQVGQDGKVFVFDPDPRNFHCLEQNIRLNGLDDRIIAVPKALLDRSCTLSLNIINRDPSQSSLYRTEGDNVSVEVECIALDAFLDCATTIDVLKMDVEGAEVRALRGMEQTLARSRNRLVMFIECQPGALLAAGSSTQELLDFLNSAGFKLQIIDEERGCLKPLDPELEKVHYVNLYCTREAATDR